MIRYYAFGIALAVAVGFMLAHSPIASAPIMAKGTIMAMIAFAITLLAWKLYAAR